MKSAALVARVAELVRFYQAALVNALFGFGLYSLLVWLGLNIYAAQLISHVCGVIFNYFTYSRHVFRDKAPAKAKFMLSYAAQYLLGLLLLVIFKPYIASPYLLGLAVLVVASVINFIILRSMVFTRPAVK